VANGTPLCRVDVHNTTNVATRAQRVAGALPQTLPPRDRPRRHALRGHPICSAQARKCRWRVRPRAEVGQPCRLVAVTSFQALRPCDEAALAQACIRVGPVQRLGMAPAKPRSYVECAGLLACVGSSGAGVCHSNVVEAQAVC
jgi:hypothetical protein